MNTRRVSLVAISAFLLSALVGCGNYTVTFQVGDVINAYGDDNTRQQLEVDIVCLRGKDAKRYEELARGGVKSDEWFRMRDAKDSKLAGLEDRIYMLVAKGRDLPGKSLGEPLLSGMDYKDGNRARRYSGVRFPEFTEGDAVILVYGRFYDKSGLRKNDPVIIDPPANDKLMIRVDRERMSWTDAK